jgi:hypothetical protein
MNTANSIVLCFYSTTAPRTTTLNRAATARAINSAGAATNAARLYNSVINAKGTAVGRAVSLQNQTGTLIRRHCMPCSAGGHYVRVRDVPRVQDIFDDAQLELDSIREDILSTYPEIISGVRQRLGAFAQEVVIPTASEIAAKFSIALAFTNQPAPIDGPVLSGLSEEVANRVRAESKAQVQDMLRKAHAAPVQDLSNTLLELIDRLRNADRLHLSQFDKLDSEVRRVRGLNVLALPEINTLLDAAQGIADLKHSMSTAAEDRALAAGKAEKVAAQADETLNAIGL